MAKSERNVVILAAILANAAIAIIKFIAALVTGSSAMLSEAVHSLIDTGNEGFLIVGLRRAKKRPDSLHPFGYGKELYFWAFLVAILIFALGGGMSIYEGISHIQQPHPIRNALWNYVVLGCAFLFEGTSFTIAYRHFRRKEGRRRRLWTSILVSKDPSLFTVLLEDFAAIVGIAIAFLGVALSQYFHEPKLDGWASIGIGLLLLSVSTVLANETRNLLVGESLRPETLEEIQRIIWSEPNVSELLAVLSMHLGPQNVLLNIRVHFRAEISHQELTRTVQRLVINIRRAHPEIKQVFFAAEDLASDLKRIA